MAEEIPLPTPHWRDIEEQVKDAIKRECLLLESVTPDRLADKQGYIRALRWVADTPQRMASEAALARSEASEPGYHS